MFKNINIKIICLLISVLIFFYVRYEAEDNKEYEVNVEVINIPQGLTILESSNLTTLVNIKMFKDKYITLPDKITAFINLENAEAGVNSYEIELDFEASQDIKRSTSIKPRKIDIMLEKGLRKEVSVIPNITGKTNEKINKISVNPNIISIYGPQSLVEKITSVNTSKIDITDIKRNYAETKYLIIPNNMVADINTTKVSILFTENMVSKQYTNINISINNLNSMFNIETEGGYEIEFLVLKGTENAIANLEYSNILPYLDLRNIKEKGEYTDIPIKINLPNNISISEIKPSSLTVIAKEND